MQRNGVLPRTGGVVIELADRGQRLREMVCV